MKLRAQAFLSAILLCACAHSPDGSRVGQTTTTGFTLPGSTAGGSNGVDTFSPKSSNPELADPAHPANRLGTAACERKQECDEIGDGKPHASPQACLMTARRHAHEQLDQLSCENGLDEKAFEQCLKSMRIAECALTDSMTKHDACAKHTLCAR